MIIIFVTDANNMVSFNPEQVIVEISAYDDSRKRIQLQGFYNNVLHLVGLGEAARIEEKLRTL